MFKTEPRQVGGPMDHLVGECRTYSQRVDTHSHPYAQLLLPLQGVLYLQTPGAEATLDEAHLFFVPPHCEHSFFAKETNKFLVLDIPKTLVQKEPLVRGRAFLQALDERWRAVRTLMWEDLAANDGRAQDSTAGLKHLVSYAVSLLQAPLEAGSGLGREAGLKSQQYILAHYDQPITLETLAALEGYTVSYFCEWFKKLTGQTPNGYLQAVRLNRAKELLAQTERPITEIAQAVGYEYPASLTRLFRQQLDLSPQQYRLQSRNLDKPLP